MTEQMKQALYDWSEKQCIEGDRINFDRQRLLIQGAKWFHKNMWHDGKEKPDEKYKGAFLIQWECGQYDVVGYSALTWRTVTLWAYLDDIKAE